MAGRPNAEDEEDQDEVGSVGSDGPAEDAFRYSGDDTDGGEPEADAAERAAEEDEERVRPRSRRDYRDEARAAREHAARIEAELTQLRAQVQSQNQGPREPTDQEFEQQIAQYPESEQFRYRSYRQDQKLQRALAQNSLQTRDFIDKSSYDSKAMADPDRRKLAGRVEQTLAQWRQGGLWQATREDAYYWLKGQISEQNRGRTAEARRQGEDRVARQQGRTQGGRSDQPPGSRARRYAPDDRSPEAVKARLLGPDGRGVLI